MHCRDVKRFLTEPARWRSARSVRWNFVHSRRDDLNEVVVTEGWETVISGIPVYVSNDCWRCLQVWDCDANAFPGLLDSIRTVSGSHILWRVAAQIRREGRAVRERRWHL